MSSTTMTLLSASSPATEALDAFLAPTSKRVKRSVMDSPQASFSFDMTELFSMSSEAEAFPSISAAWSFDNDSEDDTASVASSCTNNSTESSLGKRTSSGLSRSKSPSTSLDLLG